MRAFVLAAVLASAPLWSACGDTGRERVDIALSAEGVAARPVMLSGATLTLTRADVAFGPVWLCASEGARAELCEVALAELRDTVVMRALDPTPQPLGALTGTTGDVRSSLFDYGISWLLTASTPQPSARAVDGHSAILEGTLTRDGRTVRFRAAIDVLPRVRGDAALNAQRTSHTIEGEGERMTLIADPHRWVDRLDPAALLALDADGDGAISIDAGTVAYESILQGMVSRAPVTFRWD